MSERPSTSVSSWLAAGLLAILTVFVFATLTHYGPESAVRRFHEAIIRGDQEGVALTLMQPVNNSDAQKLLVGVADARQRGARIIILGRLRQPSQTLVDVQYRFPNRMTVNVRYSVRKRSRHGEWVIDAVRTVQMLEGRD